MSSAVVPFLDLIGHDIRQDGANWFCATCEYPICSRCKCHPRFVDDEDGSRYECERHGFVCWNTEP